MKREKEKKKRPSPQVERSTIEEGERRREAQGKWMARAERRGEGDLWLSRVLSCQRG